MNLISTLNAGIAAAANGWAEIYIRGTSTRATWYANFEASTSNSSGANIPLDAYGAVEVYVNQLVDVVAKSADGTVVRSWTDGYSSPNVEVISPSFTGADYVSGATAVNEPTTLQAVLNLWETNSGAPDWKVDIAGTATTLVNAFGTLNGLVFNVKNPAYGAVGDGVTNDQSAIQAALAAAVAAGGGIVFFPKGTYVISSAVEWDHRVSMVGVGGALSIISTNSASNAKVITLTAGTKQAAPTVFTGMGFSASQVNTGEQFQATVGINALFSDCIFGVSTNCTGTCASVVSSSSRTMFRDCVFNINGATNSAASAAGDVAYDRCYFITTGTSGPTNLLLVGGRSNLILGCIFDYTSLTVASSSVAIRMTGAVPMSVIGCSFIPLAQTLNPCLYLIGDTTNTVIAEGNDFQFQVNWYTVNTARLGDASRLQKAFTTSTNSTAFSVTTNSGVHSHVSNTTIPTVTMPSGAHRGDEKLITFNNNSGGGWLGVPFAGASVQRVTTLTAVDVPNSATVAVRMVWDGSVWLMYVKA